ncbi:MAG: cytochrome b/b6 domain-containing protein [Ignavibacteriae bacterium]|nr:cytochrome b/b6 domain-containing protein [Ignavibacteriota bacterium]MCB9247799.1 cytochrome b/b6 domain-containing protein [Ignavibacteriales bacterium]
MTKKVYVYRSFERFWHWLQAILIIFLAFSGFEIHGLYKFFGFEEAVLYHNIAAYLFIILIVFAIFWHFTTGEWRQYIPTYKNLSKQMQYYLWGMFKNEPHPTKKTVLRKLNPMQKLTYFGLKVLVIPVMVTSGLLYMLFRYPQGNEIQYLNIASLEIIALVHTIAAFFLISFVIVHLYLITTGETLTSNLKAMLTGYEELEDDDESETKKLEENK